MKKLFFAITAMILLASAPVYAQLVAFGVTGDLAFIKSDKDAKLKTSDFNPDMGWSAGIKIKVSTPLGLGADAAIKYAQEDVAYTLVPNAGTGVAVSDKSAFLAVPINFRYELKLPMVSRIAIPYAFAGPQFNYNITGIDLKDKTIAGANEELQNYIKENKVNWNLNIGVGVVLARHLEVFYNYSIGMSDKYEFDDIKSTIKTYKDINSSIENKTSRVGVTYYF